MDWNIEPGRALTRREVHARFGGQQQGGISTPQTNPNVMIFTDPHKGSSYGYNRHEGLTDDGRYLYTGEGQVGDQLFVRGNAAIRDAARNGKAIRLFTAKDTIVTYVGSFRLDEPGWSYQMIPDGNGDLRRAIVFTLVPHDADTELVPVTPKQTSAYSQDWQPRNTTPFNTTLSPSAGIATREEFELEARFGSWRIADGHSMKTVVMKYNGRALLPDLYDETLGEIIEVKRSTASASVRTAIGQALDYVHCAARTGTPATPAILLPKAPNIALIDLCRSLNIRVYVPAGKHFHDCANPQ